MIWRTKIRKCLRLAFWPALVVLALNIEKMAEAFGWDKLLVQNWSPAVDEVLSSLQSAWFRYPAILLVGASAALWLDAILRRRESDPKSLATEVAPIQHVVESIPVTGTTELKHRTWPETSDYDLPIKLRVIDELLVIVGSEKEFEQTARHGSRFLREWKNEISRGRIKELLEDLKEYRDKCLGLQKKIKEIRKDNERYEDIYEILDFGNSKNIIASLNRLMVILDALGASPPSKFAYFVGPAAEELSSSLTEFGSWRFETERSLLARRKELSG